MSIAAGYWDLSFIFATLRKYFQISLILLLSFYINGCSSAVPEISRDNNEATKTVVYVIGTIHSSHLESQRYSLAILERAIRKANPDQIFAEIPPDRLVEAWRGFRDDGVVSEPRVRIFPEYRDVIFPLSSKMKFEIVATAGWTKELSDYRDKALCRIAKDQSRAKQWEEHQMAQSAFSKAEAGRGDDPLFIHTNGYDNLVKKAQHPYETYFERDLGKGGWKAINAAHNRLINDGLDKISGHGKVVVVTFGAWHKYMILNNLKLRDDVILRDSSILFQ
jgi:hypothetical protein